MTMPGPDGVAQRKENFIKRLFWPANRPDDVDTLGRQGLWVCVTVGVIFAALALAGPNPLLAMLVLTFYVTGGMGVREGSTTAAVLLAAGFLASLALVVLRGGLPGIIDPIIGPLLLANIRATHIASSWREAGPELFPSLDETTSANRFSDRWPAWFWPWGRFVFFTIAALYGALFVFGMVRTLGAQ